MSKRSENDVGQQQPTRSKFSASFLNFWSRIDMFGLPVQSFNHKGKNKVASGPGTIMTMLILIIALVYATSKVHHMQAVIGQTVSSFEEEHEFRSPDHQLNLNERNFRVAFKYRQTTPNTL